MMLDKSPTYRYDSRTDKLTDDPLAYRDAIPGDQWALELLDLLTARLGKTAEEAAMRVLEET